MYYFWLGYFSFFSLGNTNSFATIDINGGYVGMNGNNNGNKVMMMMMMMIIIIIMMMMIMIMMILGLQHQNLLFTGIISLFVVHSGPLLMTISYIITLTSKPEQFIHLNFASNVFNIFIFSLFFTFYCITMLIIRYHLFVWSVFAPKFWYLLFYAALTQIYFSLSFIFGLLLRSIDDSLVLINIRHKLNS
jgi:ethanolaminephosphotransferase